MIKVILGIIWLKYLLSILWLILFIWALIDILDSKKDTGWKALWIIICLILPILGVILYALFGRK